jgi:hypothetical protein
MKLFEVQNKSPKWQLTEAAQGKDFHIQHLEDLIFSEGFNGAKRAFNYIENIRRMFARGQGKVGKVRVKWDGSTNIVCGIDPEDGKFFVGTEQALIVKEAATKTKAEIYKFYGYDEVVTKQLKLALRYLPSLGIGNVMAGNLLFIEENILISNVGGRQIYTFTPNNTSYSVVVDSELGNKISQSKIGICFHTSYEGNNLLDMTSTKEANIVGLKSNKNVWIDNDTYKDYTGIASFTPEENARVLIGLRKSASTITKIDPSKFNGLINNLEFSEYLKKFVHSNINDKQMMVDPMRLTREFIEFYKERARERNNSTVNDASKQIEKIEKFIGDNLNAILGVFSVYKKIIELKLLILDKIKQVENTGIFVKDNNGYKVNVPGKFVAIGNDRTIVNLVTTIEYSER